MEPGHTYLTGIVSGFGQAGCLGGPATGSTDVTVTRTDNAASWIRSRLFYGDQQYPTLASGGRLDPGSVFYAHGKAALIMQGDGNLVLYAESGAVLWASHTYGNPGAYAVLQGDGNFVVYKKDGGEGKGGALWSTGTWGNPGARLVVGYARTSPSTRRTATRSCGRADPAGELPELCAAKVLGPVTVPQRVRPRPVRHSV